jgi:hypothetical protein
MSMHIAIHETGYIWSILSLKKLIN